MTSTETGTRPDQLLTSEERRQWETDGYLHVRGVLSPAEVAKLLAELEELRRRFSQDPDDPRYWADVFHAGNDRDLSIANGVSWSSGLHPLLDHPGVFGRVLGIMGPYLQVLGSEIFYRYPSRDPLVDFHTDVGPALRPAVAAGDWAYQIKAQFFLTDVSQADRGNFTVAPGSHLAAFPGRVRYGQVANPRQILASAGDVVLFPLTLGHSVAPNTGDTARVSVILRYGRIYQRPADYWRTPDREVMDRLTPRRRRLLGDLGDLVRPGDCYGPVSDQLTLIYGEEWSATEQARADLARSRADSVIYEEP